MATNLEVSPPPAAIAPLMRLAAIAPQLGLLFTMAAGLTLAAGVVMWAMRPSFVPLDVNLSDRSSADVITMLQSSQTRYEMDPSSGRIFVPSEKLAEIRMQLLGAGLAGGSTMGSEMLQEDQSIGTSTQLLNERFRLVRETELSRTIASLRGVDAARVHLALPKQTSFVRNRSRSSASVMLKLSPGRSLDAAQVQGIVNLVASSVPNMDVANVTVVDQFSRLLSRDAAGGELAISSRQFEYQKNFERSYVNRIEGLLAPIIGVNGVRAQVNAELDFTANERHEEAFASKPNNVRSEQIEDNRSEGATLAGGVPGALSNQPPAGGKVGDAAAGETTAGAAGSVAKSTMRNYELDKTVTHTRVAPGRLLRLSVAVLIDDHVVFDKKGKPTRTSREKEELDSITGLVKEAIGFNAERGDTVVIVNRAFEMPAEIESAPEPALWEQSWFDAMVKNTLAAIVMGLLLMLVLRPAVAALTRKVDAANEASTTGPRDNDSLEFSMMATDKVSLSGASGDPLPPPPRVYGDILNLAREMANDDPKRVAMVLRKWVESDE
ncbi:MAG: flagellar M-ring protein FliF [Gammaproteobacteria bacterium]|jgi:flagellar M-ring protein FliF